MLNFFRDKYIQKLKTRIAFLNGEKQHLENENRTLSRRLINLIPEPMTQAAKMMDFNMAMMAAPNTFIDLSVKIDELFRDHDRTNTEFTAIWPEIHSLKKRVESLCQHGVGFTKTDDIKKRLEKIETALRDYHFVGFKEWTPEENNSNATERTNGQ